MPLSSIRLIAAGFLLALLSSFGQTFSISLFGGEIREAFALPQGLRHHLRRRHPRGGQPAGRRRRIDGTGSSIVGLVIMIFAPRLAGQGMMNHASATMMARYFTANRGKAVSAAALGHPAGEALLPVVAVAVAAAIGWRETWLATAAILLMTAPLLLGLLGTCQTPEALALAGAVTLAAAAGLAALALQRRAAKENGRAAP